MLNNLLSKLFLFKLCFYISASLENYNSTAPRKPYPNEKYVYKSYQTSVYCTASSDIRHPVSISEVQQIVKEAISIGKTVKAIGSRHSITDVICTEGIPISMENINYTIANNDGTATVGGGAEMKDVLEFLHSKSRTLIHVPTFGGISVGGAIGTGAHGSSLLHPTSLSDQMVKLTIVDGTGQIRVIEDPRDVNAFRVHLGLLGVLVDVTLKTVPSFKMNVKNSLESEEILFDGTAIKWAQEMDWFELWWFPNTDKTKTKTVVVSKGNYTSDIEMSGNATTNLIPDQTSAEIMSARDAFETLHGTRNKLGLYAIQDFTQFSIYQDVVGKPAFYSEDGRTIKNPATGHGWQLQSNKCVNKCPWDNSNNSIYPEESAMAFEISELPAVITTMKNILNQVKATFTLIGVFIRFSPPSDSLMGISAGRQTVHIEWANPMRRDPYGTAKDGLGAYQAILQAMVKQHGGRPHWGKNGLYYTNPDIIKLSSPNREAFIQYMKKYDPNGIFLNKFGRRLLGTSRDMDTDPNVKRCALQDYCVCSKNSDCAPLQQCVMISGYPACTDIGSGFLPTTLRSYNPTNLSSIFESIEMYSFHSEQLQEEEIE